MGLTEATNRSGAAWHRWCASALLLAATMYAGAQDPKPARNDLHVNAATYRVICDRLGLNEAQQLVADRIFEQYTADLGQMTAVARQAVQDAGFRRSSELWNETLGDMEWRLSHEDSEAPWDEFDALYHQYHPVKADWHKRKDRRLEQFYAELSEILSEGQLETFAQAPQLVRRRYYERKYPPGATSGQYVQLVTPTLLLEEIPADAPELSWLAGWNREQPNAFDHDDHVDHDDDDDDDHVQALTAVKGILDTYDAAYDQLIIKEINHWRRKLRPDESTRTNGNRRLKDAVSRYLLRHNTILQIGDVIGEATDDTARLIWLDTYYRRRNPELFQERWPDRMMVDWLAQQPDATEEQIAAAEQLRADYQMQRDGVRQAVVQAVDHTIRQMTSSNGEHRALLRQERLKMQLRELIDRNFDQLRALLTPNQSAALDDAILHASAYQQRLLGPVIEPSVVDELTSHD